jgi:hypothetical protein
VELEQLNFYYDAQELTVLQNNFMWSIKNMVCILHLWIITKRIYYNSKLANVIFIHVSHLIKDKIRFEFKHKRHLSHITKCGIWTFASAESLPYQWHCSSNIWSSFFANHSFLPKMVISTRLAIFHAGNANRVRQNDC